MRTHPNSNRLALVEACHHQTPHQTTPLSLCLHLQHSNNTHYDCCRYLDGEDLLMLCAEVDFPPCLMVRRMLEGMMGLSKQVR